MQVIGYLKKQPKWKMHTINGKFHSGWCEATHGYSTDANGKYTWGPKEGLKESDVPILEGTLALCGWGRGRSSVTFTFKDSDGHEYEAATSAAYDIFRCSGYHAGEVSGQWTFIKQGTQISIVPYVN